LSTLKELTAEVHAEAESQPFIKSIFAGNVDIDKYTDYTFQLIHLYGMLEALGDTHKLFEGMEELKRAPAAELDYVELIGDKPQNNKMSEATFNYLQYLNRAEVIIDPKKILAHIYVRHMGDLFGGQQLAKLTPGNGHMYKFDDIPKLIKAVRSKIDPLLADEAIIAFKHNIEMIKVYND
jgi:heme oxygenase